MARYGLFLAWLIRRTAMGGWPLFVCLRPVVGFTPVWPVAEWRTAADRTGSAVPAVIFTLLLVRPYRGLVKYPYGYFWAVESARDFRLRGFVISVTRYVSAVAYFARLPVTGLAHKLV